MQTYFLSNYSNPEVAGRALAVAKWYSTQGTEATLPPPAPGVSWGCRVEGQGRSHGRVSFFSILRRMTMCSGARLALLVYGIIMHSSVYCSPAAAGLRFPGIR